GDSIFAGRDVTDLEGAIGTGDCFASASCRLERNGRTGKHLRVWIAELPWLLLEANDSIQVVAGRRAFPKPHLTDVQLCVFRLGISRALAGAVESNRCGASHKRS